MKSRKWISVLMAFAMVIMAVLPTLVSAQAATAAELKQLLASYETTYGFTSIGTNAEKQAASLVILEAYQSLSGDAAKDGLGMDTISNVVKVAYQYYYKTIGSNSTNISNAILSNIATAAMQEAYRLSRLVYGSDPYGDNAVKFAANTSFFTTNANAALHRAAYTQLLAELEAASPLVKQYLLLNSGATYNSAPPYSEVPARAAQLHVYYLEAMGASRTEAMNKTMSEYAALSEELTAGLRFAKAGFDLIKAYETSGTALDTAGFAELKAKAEALSPAAQSLLGKFSGVTATSWVLGSVGGRQLPPVYVKDFALKMDELLSIIGLLKAYDYDNASAEAIADVTAAVQSFKSANSALYYYLETAGFAEVYAAIQASTPRDGRPARDEAKPSTEGYEQTKPDYDNFASKFFAARALGSLDALAVTAIDLLMGSLGNAVYTNDSVNSLILLNSTVRDMLEVEAIALGYTYSLLTAMLFNGARPEPHILAGHLYEPEYAENAAKLAVLTGWDEFDPADYDWGVKDGDRAAFEKAAIAVLRPVLSLLYYHADIPDVVDETGAYVSDGTYETAIIPFLEALGCEGILSADQFMNRALALPASDTTKYGKRQNVLGQALLIPILNLLDKVSTDPLNTILDLLPRLAYAEQQGDLDPLYDITLLIAGTNATFMPFRSLQALVDMIAAGFLPEGTVLSPIDWAALASMGKLQAEKSVNGSSVYKNFVAADRTDVMEFLKAYLLEILSDEAAAEPVSTALAEALGLSLTWEETRDLAAALIEGNPLKVLRSGFTVVKSLLSGSGSGGNGDGGSGGTEPGSTISTGDIIKAVFKFLGLNIKNRFVFYFNVITGKVAVS